MEIPLDPRAIAHPVRLDLAIVEGTMLWPEDPTSRQRLREAAMVAELVPRLPDMAEDDLRAYAARAAAAMPVASFTAEATERFNHASLIGARLLNALSAQIKAPGSGIGLGEAEREICRAMAGTRQIMPRTLNNRSGPYHKFRPVAHLWAAHLLARFRGVKTFPCQIDDLPMFLAVAEAIRARAETTRSANAPNTLIRPGEAVSLPAGVIAALPAVSLG